MKRSLIERALGGRALAEYEGLCGELADAILHIADGEVLYIETPGDNLRPVYSPRIEWKYHQVAVVGGLVHDPWAPFEPLPVTEYLLRAFPDQPCTYEIFR